MNETFEKPMKYTPNNICYWEETSKELKFDKSKGATAMLSKAKHFLENNCIVEISENEWRCKPIPKYNSTTYKIFMKYGVFECSCQGYRKKLSEGVLNPICSHILSVKQFKYIKEKNKMLSSLAEKRGNDGLN